MRARGCLPNASLELEYVYLLLSVLAFGSQTVEIAPIEGSYIE
jgi:hypothetical protein